MRMFLQILVMVLALMASASAYAQTPEVIGRIEGGAFTARGQVSVAQEGERSVTTLLSGSEVVVTSGHARLTLVDGSEVDICGPAQLSLLKAGGAITLALSHGRVHARISAELPLQIYTAMIVVTPVSVGGQPRDANVGLDAAGELCVYAAHGAIRLEHQFSGQKVLVPQLGEVSVPGGQIENLREAAGACRCDMPVAKRAEPQKPAEPAMSERAGEKSEEQKKTEEGPLFTAVMPPLTFSAESPAPPPLPRPQMIRMTREVRLRPVVFSGRVERPVRASQRPAEPVAASTSGGTPPETVKVGFGTRIKNFFRRLFGGRQKT